MSILYDCARTYLTVQQPYPVTKLQSGSARGMTPAEATEARATTGAMIEAERIMKVVDCGIKGVIFYLDVENVKRKTSFVVVVKDVRLICVVCATCEMRCCHDII